MKKLYLLLLALISFSAQAQTTKVFPDSVAYWRSMNLYIDDNTYNISIADYIMLGDTLVDNKIYKNLFLHKRAGYKYVEHYYGNRGYYNYFNDKYGLSNKIGLLRKDSLKVFFRYNKGRYFTEYWGIGKDDSLADKGKEYLLVDYGWDVGDTVFSEYYTPGSGKYIIVEEKGTKILSGWGANDTVEAIKFGGKGNNGRYPHQQNFIDSNSIILGMGFIPFFLRLYDFDTSGDVNSYHYGSWRTSDFCSDGSGVFINTRLPIESRSIISFDCNKIDIEVSVGINQPNKPTLSAYPNPAKDYITLSGFEGENITAIQTSDIVGHKQELKYDYDGSQALVDISALPQGLYMVTVYTDKTTYLCRIIKQ